MQLSDLDFELPEELIAQHPLQRRDECRMLCLDRSTSELRDGVFNELCELLRPGDVLVRNTSRVMPGRLRGVKQQTGGQCEILLLEPKDSHHWWALVRPAKRLKQGTTVLLRDGTPVRVVEEGAEGQRLLEFQSRCSVEALAEQLGETPLPPYIKRPVEAADRLNYQTVYATAPGSVAAPTAGLHFTTELLQDLKDRGIHLVDLSLHVGLGTFEPLRTQNPVEHPMHWERFELSKGEWDRLLEYRKQGRRIIAVGTTATRVLESLALWERGKAGDRVELTVTDSVLKGRTRLFIFPPFEFSFLGALITNFHLPRTTLLMLVDAVCGRSLRQEAYAHAVKDRYRFFSYGDAMFIE